MGHAASRSPFRSSPDNIVNLTPNRAARREASSAISPVLLAGWMRWFAVLCVLFLGAASTAQAAHNHGSARTAAHQQWDGPSDGQNTPSGDEHCPLCVAMHSVLPAALPAAPGPPALVLLTISAPAERDVAADWHFARFSRPPPISR